MSKHQLPQVLPFPAHQTEDRPARATGSAPADTLDRAMAALRAAMQAEAARAAAPQERRGAPRARGADAFTPVGAPPRWRAGSRRRGSKGDRSGAARPSATTLQADVDGPATDRDALARRIVSVHLPDFAMERWLRWAERHGALPPDDLPVALATEGGHGPVVHACNRAARLAGIALGARVVDMRTLCPELQVEWADPAGDAAALHKLMMWMRRWCPWTAVDGADGIVMDTTGSDHLWGGEPQMLREIEAGLSTLGLSSGLALAPTPGAAWGLARFGGVRRISTAERLTADIAPLPARALRLGEDTVLLLKRLGLKSVGDLLAVPRLSLTRRFGQAALADNPLLRLDQMTGKLTEPVSAPEEPPRFAVQARLPEPVQDPVPHLPALCEELCAGLAHAGCGARGVTVTLYRTDGEVSSVSAATARPTRDAAHLLRLFDDRLSQFDPGFGFDLITLSARHAEDQSHVQTRLDGRPDETAALARMVDRLSARLGVKAVQCPHPEARHKPEAAETRRPALSGPPTPAVPRALRPMRLFETPEEVRVLYAVPEGPPAQFVWRRMTHRVVRFAGPERIAPEWWADMPGTRLRDYYQVEDQGGRRIWMYREGVLGDARGTTPRWFIHGVFA